MLSCVKISGNIYVQLHIFCGASEVVYFVVSYFNKVRLSPIKTISLQRLELNSEVTGVPLYKLIIKETDLPVNQVLFWTDLKLVLQHIKEETQCFKGFAANRVSGI